MLTCCIRNVSVLVLTNFSETWVRLQTESCIVSYQLTCVLFPGSAAPVVTRHMDRSRGGDPRLLSSRQPVVETDVCKPLLDTRFQGFPSSYFAISHSSEANQWDRQELRWWFGSPSCCASSPHELSLPHHSNYDGVDDPCGTHKDNKVSLLVLCQVTVSIIGRPVCKLIMVLSEGGEKANLCSEQYGITGSSHHSSLGRVQGYSDRERKNRQTRISSKPGS